MTRDTITMTEALSKYLHDVSLQEPDVLRRLRQETANMPNAGMQIGPLQGQFMQLLLKLQGAKRTLEVGVFTGYSSLWTALALPDDGKVVACDVSEEWTSIGRRYWEEAGVAHKIDLRLGPAAETLAAMITNGESESFDFAFIDADKENYGRYYEQCMKLVRPGGLIAVDNALWSGQVADPEDQSASTEAIRSLNQRVVQDERVDHSLMQLGDGLMLAWKRVSLA